MSPAGPTIGSALKDAAARLATVSPSPRLDAELMLAASLERPRGVLLAHTDDELPGPARTLFESLLARRLAGEPLAYVLGRKEFWSLDLEISGDVLVPRPETELLVEFALATLPADKAVKVLDLGTGSGAIALAIAHELPLARVLMTDVSPEALVIACRNAERLQLSNITFAVGSWFEPVGAMHFDLIVSNPPYVASGDSALQSGDVAAEPRLALTPGPSGLEAIEIITTGAKQHLRTGGWLALEHGAGQAEAVAALLSQHGLSNIRGLKDLAGKDRVTVAQKE